MCLIVKDKTPKIAEKDFIGYKVVIKVYDNKYNSPYRRTLINLGEVMQAYNANIPIWEDYDGRYLIEGQGFHFYKTKEAAELTITTLRPPLTGTYEIIKVVVRSGNPYWESNEHKIINRNEELHKYEVLGTVTSYAAPIVEHYTMDMPIQQNLF